jgi:hypothetical protein
MIRVSTNRPINAKIESIGPGRKVLATEYVNDAGHQHIDSSGAFTCPIGSACKMPPAGEQFDQILELFQDTLTSLENMTSKDFSRGADKPIRDAIINFLKAHGVHYVRQ